MSAPASGASGTQVPDAGNPAPFGSLASAGSPAPAGGPSVAEGVGRELARLGVGHVFGVVGSGNFALTNALRAAGVPFTAARHEGGAANMADAYARTSGKVAALSVHQGCGLTNAATGIGEAAKSRTPLLVLAAESPLDQPANNFAMDQAGLAAALGAEHVRVDSAATALERAGEAFALALGRRTVLLNLPIDVQAQQLVPELVHAKAVERTKTLEPAAPEVCDDGPGGSVGAAGAGGDASHAGPGDAGTATKAAPLAPSAEDLSALVAAVSAAKRPVIIAGRGGRGFSAELRALAAEAGALLATSAVAKGLFAGDAYDLGISGGFATPLAAELIAGADLVLAFGCALNDWTTRRGALLGPETVLVQVDDTAAALGRHRPLTLAVHADVGATARTLTTALLEARGSAEAPARYRTAEVAAAIAQRGSWNTTPTPDLSGEGRIDPRVVTAALDQLLPRERVVSIDSGNFMGYPSQYLAVPDEAGFCFTQAFQSIGLGLGTAIGAQLASPGRLGVLGTGDGGFLMGISELETAVRLELPLLVVVYDDAAYGAEVHHFGAPVAAGPAATTPATTPTPTPTPTPAVDLGAVTFPERDLAQIARGFGANGQVVRGLGDLGVVGQWLARAAPGLPTVPLVLDVKIASDGGAWWLQEAFAKH